MTTQRPHSSALRRGRFSEPGRAYLVTATCAARAPLFSDWRVGRHVVAQLRLAQESNRADSLAWVVMPDHLHWLLVLREADLSTVMRRVKSLSARIVNAYPNRSGPVWQDGYHDHAIRAEENLREVARYVIANPVRAGLVAGIGDYPLWDAVWL